eukprot:5325844-Prymnesium_polylepis.1
MSDGASAQRSAPPKLSQAISSAIAMSSSPSKAECEPHVEPSGPMRPVRHGPMAGAQHDGATAGGALRTIHEAIAVKVRLGVRPHAAERLFVRQVGREQHCVTDALRDACGAETSESSTASVSVGTSHGTT